MFQTTGTANGSFGSCHQPAACSFPLAYTSSSYLRVVRTMMSLDHMTTSGSSHIPAAGRMNLVVVVVALDCGIKA